MSLITLILVLAAVAALIVVGTRKKDGGGKRALPRTVVTVAAVLVLIGALGFGSVYQLQEDEYAVITTFGKPSVVSTPGLKFKIPIIQQKTIVSKATQGFALGYDLRTNVNNEDESLMISVDFNFVNVDFYVEYRVDDPVKYLYNSEEPEAILKMLCQSYIRDTIGLYGVDDIITTGKAEIQGVIRDKISTRLEQEDIGLLEQQTREVHARFLAAGEAVEVLLPLHGGDAEAVADLVGLHVRLIAAAGLKARGKRVVFGKQRLVRPRGHLLLKLAHFALDICKLPERRAQHILDRIARRVMRNLGDEADLPARRKAHLAGVVVQLPGQNFEERRLARAVPAEQAHALPCLNVKADAVQQIRVGVEALDQVLYRNIDHICFLL